MTVLELREQVPLQCKVSIQVYDAGAEYAVPVFETEEIEYASIPEQYTGLEIKYMWADKKRGLVIEL